jgi:hypothetical protein
MPAPPSEADGRRTRTRAVPPPGSSPSARTAAAIRPTRLRAAV